MNNRFLTIMFCCISFSLACKQAETTGDAEINKAKGKSHERCGENCLEHCGPRINDQNNGGIEGGAYNFTTITYSNVPSCKNCNPCTPGYNPKFKNKGPYKWCKNHQDGQDDCKNQ